MKTLIPLSLSLLLSIEFAFGKAEFQSDNCTIHFAEQSENKIVLVVSGDCKFYLRKAPSNSGNAQIISSVLDHTAIFIYRTGAYFKSDDDWSRLCNTLKKHVGHTLSFEAVDISYSLTASDIELITTRFVRIIDK
jgi:hypothetical protein